MLNENDPKLYYKYLQLRYALEAIAEEVVHCRHHDIPVNIEWLHLTCDVALYDD